MKIDIMYALASWLPVVVLVMILLGLANLFVLLFL
jgi:hypothetical protein